MPQAAQPSSSRPSANNPSWRIRFASHGDVEASACAGEIDRTTVEGEATASQVVGGQAVDRAVSNANATLTTLGEREVIASTVVFTVLTWIYTKATEIVSAGVFPASRWCYYLFHCMPDSESVLAQSQREYSVRWEAALGSITRSWKATQSTATSLLLVSALAVLQLDDALNNRAICTGIAAAILLALASILSSFVYLLSKERFISRWKTSEKPDKYFWRCVGMPLDFAIWSFVFFICTVFFLIYKRMLPTPRAEAPGIDQPTINSPGTSGAIAVTVLSIFSVCKIYYGLFFLLRHRSTDK
ncbi:hypothetical protein CPC08DRAFT_824270 [Agrocybe pediades]|nr:hypothetical protein CPC08DRAFT_824270 [Agrocybe pediades]